MKGLYQWPIKKMIAPEGVINMALFDTVMAQITDIGASGPHICFAGTNAWNQIRQFNQQYLQTTQSETIAGWTIKMLRTGYGDVPVEPLRVMNASKGLADAMFIVDISKIHLLHMEGNGESLRDHVIQAPQTRGNHTEEYIMSGTFGLRVDYAENCHAWISGAR